MAKTRKAKKDREVICADALKWLEQQKGLDCIVTSIPEMEEVKLKEDAYRLFMAEAVRKALRATKDTGYTIFLQTDRKKNGWIDKSYLISAVAEE